MLRNRKSVVLFVVLMVAALALSACGNGGRIGSVPTLPPPAVTVVVPTQPVVVPTQPVVVPTQPVVVPTQPAAAPTAQPSNPNLGMKYQFDSGCAATSTPYDFPACIIQNVQSGDRGINDAVVAIQQLGAKFSAPSFEDVNLSIPNTQAAVVWCPAGVKNQGGEFAPDIAFPLKNTKGDQWTYNLFVMSAATGGPNRTVTSADPAQKCWMAYVR